MRRHKTPVHKNSGLFIWQAARIRMYSVSRIEVKKFTTFQRVTLGNGARYARVGVRTQRNFSLSAGDGIDHLFPIPTDVTPRRELILMAAEFFSARNVMSLEERFRRELGLDTGLFAKSKHRPESWVNLAILDDIASDIGARLICGSDYLMPWSLEVQIASYPYTLAEILRIVAMTEISSVPDVEARNLCVAFYRSALKISGRSTVGLSAKIFHVEHGSHAEPSLFYMGRDVILGKGLAVDVVGGFVALSGSFLGGGYMPILIHTHKHIGVGGPKASDERKSIHPVCFIARANARLPMSFVGLWESADYLGRSTPYEGIETHAVVRWGEVL